ncbi:MAG: TetR/AcrR family transcriptional regulator [Anaerolineae bacterium]|nr:TetR/AcrR family transcriptional regulator [Anaerolineae bacterium]
MPDPNPTDRRNHILDSAAVVFAAKGFHPTTIRDIAKHAGIADGTIYNYFESKPALLLAVFQRMRDTIIQAAPPPPPAGDVRATLRAMLTHPLTALRDDNFALFRVVVSEMLVNAELRALYHQHIIQPALDGAEIYLRQALPTLDAARAQLAVRAISGMVMGLTIQYTFDDPTLRGQWDSLPEHLADLLLDGLLPR